MIIHETDTLIDPRAFTVMGINSKPNSDNPIGYFGTGLKYAIAVLARHRCDVTVYIGTEAYVFFADKIIFRDKEFLQMKMKRQRGVTARWMSQDLPFTTEYGKGWDLWMAFRELHSNTLDENGRTYRSDEVCPERDRTLIVVGGDAYDSVYSDMGNIFLDASKPRICNHPAAYCTRGSSAHGFYRGLRAINLQRTAMFTWNVTQAIPLTEDRTIKYPFMFDRYVIQSVMESRDEDFIEKVLRCNDDTYEASLDWDSSGFTPTPEFIRMARIHGNKHTRGIIVEATRREEAEKKVRAIDNWCDEFLLVINHGFSWKYEELVKTHQSKLVLLLESESRRLKKAAEGFQTSSEPKASDADTIESESIEPELEVAPVPSSSYDGEIPF